VKGFGSSVITALYALRVMVAHTARLATRLTLHAMDNHAGCAGIATTYVSVELPSADVTGVGEIVKARATERIERT
jgi:hypothetical protein